MTAFERGVWVAPYWEEDAERLARHMPVERILAGSDFPHADGLAEPTDFALELTSFSEQHQRMIMRDNLRGLLAA
jgi:predicted TIM-barrel fold metal-dependent hydrolase